jgi:catechol 2,3-dioxygenase-like lactoylglutathione lyase family enzyme
MKAVALDHLVLTVASIERAAAFYVRVLGMEREVFGAQRRTALKLGSQKINLHEHGREFEPKAHLAAPGTADICLLVDSLDGIAQHLQAEGVAVIEGPVKRTGARGTLTSYYIRDPDQNLVELSTYD